MGNTYLRYFTSDDLIRFHYGETSKKENSEIREELESDFELREASAEIADVLNTLDTKLEGPRQCVIDNLLRYSRSSSACMETC